MKCACHKSSAVLFNTHTWHPLRIYTCLEMPLCPPSLVRVSLGRHLKSRGQLKHSFSRAFGEKGVQEVRNTCYFPTGAALRICQSGVSGNDSKKKDGKRGRSNRQRPDFTAKASDQWVAGLLLPANTHKRAPVNTHNWSFSGKTDLCGACQEDLRKTLQNKHRKKIDGSLQWETSIAVCVAGGSPPRTCHLDEWMWVTVN